MKWKSLLKSELEDAYRAAEGLIAMVGDDDLDWRPATGENWMTTGQLLKHIADACGMNCRGFVTGDWQLPEGIDPSEMPAEEMLPTADKMPSLASVAEATEALAADKQVALEMIDRAADRMHEPAPAPWDPRPIPLGQQLLSMIGHLNNHKGQLYYYLKLQGKPVNTMHFYGMA